MEEKYFEITVAETYTRTFRVKARDESEADDILSEAIAAGDANCDEGEYNYSCEFTAHKEVKKNEYLLTNQSEGFFRERRISHG